MLGYTSSMSHLSYLLLMSLLCPLTTIFAQPLVGDQQVGIPVSSDRKGKEEEPAQKRPPIPSPPPLIAPEGLVGSLPRHFTPEQQSILEKQQKSEADQAYAKGDYQKALVALQRAYLVSKKPRYIANQGLVLEKMRRYHDAIQALEYFLLTQPPVDKARSAQQVINRLRPEVKIISDPLGASVFIDRALEPVGVTPITFRLIAGEHPIQLRLKSHETVNTILFVMPGKPVLAQYKLDQSSSAFIVQEKEESIPDHPLNRGQLSAIVLGSVSLGVSATALWFTREAVIHREAAVTRERWKLAQGEAELFHGLSLSAAGVGFTSLAAGLLWWSLSSPEPQSEESAEALKLRDTQSIPVSSIHR